jgi:hypothetical protein
MNKREWLASQGLAEIGKRGRFSREAEAAWAAHTNPTELETEIIIGEVEELPRDGFTLAKVPVTKPIVREENLAYTIDDRGRMIAHINCGGCKENVNRCDCVGGPDGLRYIQPKQKAYLVKDAS